METLALIIALVNIPLMAFVSRMCGGGGPKVPWGLDQWLYALPYLFTASFAGWWAVPAYLVAALGKRLGHGRGFNYDLPMRPGSSPERVEVLISWLYGRVPVSAYKALIMALTGVVVPLGAAIVCGAYGAIAASAALIASGLAKAAAYALPKTEWAEYATGALHGAGIAAAAFYIMHNV